MIHYKTINDFVCTKADYETINSKAGKSYNVVKCEFRNMNTELTNVTIFANKDGWLPKLNEGETYKLKIARYYSKKSSSETEYIEVIQTDKE